eukprot:scaffold78064_cov39-Phaeocystis_antarctica.AAC.1
MRKGNFSFRLPPSRNPFLRLGAHPCITNEAPEVLDAPVRAQHHPDNMRPRRHCGARRLVEHLNDVDRTMRSRLRTAIPTLGATHRVLGLLS